LRQHDSQPRTTLERSSLEHIEAFLLLLRSTKGSLKQV
jgi:hypothetical protein